MFSGEFIPIFYLKVDFVRIMGFQPVIIALKICCKIYSWKYM